MVRDDHASLTLRLDVAERRAADAESKVKSLSEEMARLRQRLDDTEKKEEAGAPLASVPPQRATITNGKDPHHAASSSSPSSSSMIAASAAAHPTMNQACLLVVNVGTRRSFIFAY
jgi:hypothetical protein